MDPRPYQPSDRDACLAVFDSNQLPDRHAFEQFLDRNPSNFTVLEHEGAIVGCGGFHIDGDVATLIHGTIHRNFQKIGLGRFLLLFRLRQISKASNDIRFARLTSTTQTATFYQKQGFKISAANNGQHVDLMLKLTVCP